MRWNRISDEFRSETAQLYNFVPELFAYTFGEILDINITMEDMKLMKKYTIY